MKTTGGGQAGATSHGEGAVSSSLADPPTPPTAGVAQRQSSGMAKCRLEVQVTRTDYEVKPKMCLWCDGEIPFEKRRGNHCCHSHAASSRNKGARRHGRGRRPCARGTCVNQCKRSSSKFCSIECSALSRVEEGRAKNEHRLKQTGIYSEDPRRCKEFLLSLSGSKCELCCRKSWRNESDEVVPIPLVLDHKDGNATNWKVKNLRLVCGNCDMLLPTYKGRNRGNGRHLRMERYRQGKSF